MESFQLQLFNHDPFIKFSKLTISPHSANNNSYMLLKNSVETIFGHYRHCVGAIYCYEISPLGKLHVHGILAHRAPSKWVRVKKHPLYQYDIKPLDPGDEWINYCIKDQPERYHLIERSKGREKCTYGKSIKYLSIPRGQ